MNFISLQNTSLNAAPSTSNTNEPVGQNRRLSVHDMPSTSNANVPLVQRSPHSSPTTSTSPLNSAQSANEEAKTVCTSNLASTSGKKSYNTSESCLKCGKYALLLCSHCKIATYCSKNCQLNHWKDEHHKNCINKDNVT